MNKKYFPFIIIMLALLIQGCSSTQAVAATSAEPGLSPAEAGEAFYGWYLNSFGDPAAGTFTSPLADKAYQDSEYLTPSFIGNIDEVLAGFGERGGYDPFLCAQDVPQEVMADVSFFHGEQASVVMRTSFPNHFITLDLQQSSGEWKIGNITCGITADGTAKAFYTWYLGYIGDRASDEMRNPLVDKAYRDSGFLSQAFIQELDEMLAGGIPADPILMAQDIPQDFTVDPGVEEGTAIVHLQFGSETVHHLNVTMIQESGVWKINQIELAE